MAFVNLLVLITEMCYSNKNKPHISYVYFITGVNNHKAALDVMVKSQQCYLRHNVLAMQAQVSLAH